MVLRYWTPRSTALQRPGRLNPEGWAAFAAWGAMESLQFMHNPLAMQLQNSSWIKSSKEVAIKAYQEKNHGTIAQFCGQPDCVNNIGTMQNQYGTCYGGTVCASLSSTFDYAQCKSAMEEFMPAAINSEEHSNCAKDGDYYCAEQTVHIMMTDPKCFGHFKVPAFGPESCTPECVDLWKKEAAERPACMKIFDGQIKESSILAQKLTKQLILANKDPEARKAADSIGTNVTTFADVCINQKLMVV